MVFLSRVFVQLISTEISNININCNAQTLNVVCYIEIGKADWNILIGQVIPSEPYHWLSNSSQTSRGRGENIVFA